jgi:hypothetical protein
MMSPQTTLSFPAVLSNFTLTVLEGSGWYAVDYAAADPTLAAGAAAGSST